MKKELKQFNSLIREAQVSAFLFGVGVGALIAGVLAYFILP